MKLREWDGFEKRFGIPPTECKFNTEQTTYLVWLFKRETNPDITEEQVKDLDLVQDDIKRATERFFGAKPLASTAQG